MTGERLQKDCPNKKIARHVVLKADIPSARHQCVDTFKYNYN